MCRLAPVVGSDDQVMRCWKRNLREKLTAHRRFNPMILLAAWEPVVLN